MENGLLIYCAISAKSSAARKQPLIKSTTLSARKRKSANLQVFESSEIRNPLFIPPDTLNSPDLYNLNHFKLINSNVS